MCFSIDTAAFVATSHLESQANHSQKKHAEEYLYINTHIYMRVYIHINSRYTTEAVDTGMSYHIMPYHMIHAAGWTDGRAEGQAEGRADKRAEGRTDAQAKKLKMQIDARTEL